MHGWRHQLWSELAPAQERDALRRGIAAFATLGIGVNGFRPPGWSPHPRLPGAAVRSRHQLVLTGRRFGRGARSEEEEQDDAEPRLHSWHPSPDVLRRRSPGGLRLPRAAAPLEERQEDRPVRRRDPDLPPLLRQSRRRREHPADGVSLPSGGVDGRAGHEPVEDPPPVDAGRLGWVLGRSAQRGRGRASA